MLRLVTNLPSRPQNGESLTDRKSTRLNSSHTVIYTLSLHDALPIFNAQGNVVEQFLVQTFLDVTAGDELAFTTAERRVVNRSEEHTSELQSHSDLHSFPTRRSSDLQRAGQRCRAVPCPDVP